MLTLFKHPMTYICSQSTTSHHAQKLIYYCVMTVFPARTKICHLILHLYLYLYQSQDVPTSQLMMQTWYTKDMNSSKDSGIEFSRRTLQNLAWNSWILHQPARKPHSCDSFMDILEGFLLLTLKKRKGQWWSMVWALQSFSIFSQRLKVTHMSCLKTPLEDAVIMI